MVPNRASDTRQTRGTGPCRAQGVGEGRQSAVPSRKAVCTAPRNHALLRCECLLACCFTQADRLERIAEMLDAAYPRYACTRARLDARRNRYGRRAVLTTDLAAISAAA
ncbi:protein of unknown function (plasmid) [Cupriavidus taiwanensis]|nr:protein of unknown function [Cupriavidus taiwanensis]